jgi:hypothetical protein
MEEDGISSDDEHIMYYRIQIIPLSDDDYLIHEIETGFSSDEEN